jgi:shikimate kinase
MNDQKRIVLTGFMGVGKSTVAKCLSYIMQCDRLDLDRFIEENEKRAISTIIDEEGIERFREIETKNLLVALEQSRAEIISLGGGTWTIHENRELIKARNCTTVWLESTFEHCWRNISCSYQKRPLINNRAAALELFEERQKLYCLADWHFVVEPQLTLFEIASRIAEEII